MFKKILAGLLVLMMLAAGIPTASAAEYFDTLFIRDKIANQYRQLQIKEKAPSLSGWCGLVASWQLYFMGINKDRFSANGRDYYDIYENMRYTSGGYPVETFSAKEYTLEQALNAVCKDGTRDVYNLLVGFQWTSTEAGNKYGHVVVLYAILDGKVYYTESFNTSFGAKEGSPICLTISEFADYYANWMRFEGLVYFGEPTYAGSCSRYPADMYVEVTEPAEMWLEPRFLEGTAPDRMAVPHERLWVTGLYQNPEGDYFYQAVENEKLLYVPAEKTRFLHLNHDGLVFTHQQREDGTPGDRMQTPFAAMTTLHLSGTDQNGTEIYSNSMEKEAPLYDLNSEDLLTFTEGWPEGAVENLSVTLRSYCLENGKLITREETVPCVKAGQDVTALDEEKTYHFGWYDEDGLSRFFLNGKPRSGWLIYRGVHYYLDSRGAAVTGEQIVDKQQYRFSQTGALIEKIY